MNFDSTDEFTKDVKRLSKKWRSIPSDIEDAKQTLLSLYVEQEGADLSELRKSFFNGSRATILHQLDDGEIVKMRLDVAALGSNSKVRLVFVAVTQPHAIIFIEMYAKNEKNREDQTRIRRYL